MIGIRKTTEEFISEARAIHGDRYDYSLVDYVQSGKKVVIICPTHGQFLKTPVGHLRGCGCNKCVVKEESLRVCGQCGVEKTINDFFRKGKHHRKICKECVRNGEHTIKTCKDGVRVHLVSKTCVKCGAEKSVSEFGRIKDSKDGYRYYCNECRRKEWSDDKEEINQNRRDFRQRNLGVSREKANNYYSSNRVVLRMQANKWRQDNRDVILEKDRKYREEHRDEINSNSREYARNRRAIDPVFKLKGALRNRIRSVMKRGSHRRCSHTMELLGCPIEFFKKHLESKFSDGMSWENYGGKDGWHIDHIIPCVAFDLSKSEDQKKCFHYMNLQTLWADDNRKKHTKMPVAV